MNTVTLSVSSISEAKEQLAAAFRDEPHGQRISFASVDLLWKTISPKRWDIIRTMTGQGPLAIREVARRLDRDIKAVHGDMLALINAGVIDRAENGVVFPYDAVHVDFMLKAA
ncbi:HVO_A0114 family putative DNA-binding protein [Sphingomonas sp. PAMC 26617]|uniref:HVO_A0114 family putative DNA-binding protein n=1 Tax=Sphingomonas sp. PAMC 26617 TaxID=1112216 RepID=UPI00028A3797|nr:transcriptional regulator [Sphingomonas sp. PAMC 26617]